MFIYLYKKNITFPSKKGKKIEIKHCVFCPLKRPNLEYQSSAIKYRKMYYFCDYLMDV